MPAWVLGEGMAKLLVAPPRGPSMEEELLKPDQLLFVVGGLFHPELNVWLVLIIGCWGFIWFKLELMREAVRSLVPPVLALAPCDMAGVNGDWALIRF